MTFDINNLVINVDEGVPMKKRGRTVNLEDNEQTQKLKAMAVGDSFFVEGAERKDMRSVINLGKKIGVFLDARRVEQDEIYQTAGVRVWRVNEADLPRRGKGAAAPAPTPPAESDDDF